MFRNKFKRNTGNTFDNKRSEKSNNSDCFAKRRHKKSRVIICVFISVVIIGCSFLLILNDFRPYKDEDIPFTEFINYNFSPLSGPRTVKRKTIERKFWLYNPRITISTTGFSSNLYLRKEYKWRGFEWDLRFSFYSSFDILDEASMLLRGKNDTEEVSKLFNELNKEITEKYGAPKKEEHTSTGNVATMKYSYIWEFEYGSFIVYASEEFDDLYLCYRPKIESNLTIY